MPVEIRCSPFALPAAFLILRALVTEPKQFLELALQDINSNYTFATSQHPLRIQRLLIVGRLIEDILATMLAGCGYTITSVKQPDGSNRYDQDAIGEFKESDNPLERSLGSAKIQSALERIMSATDEIGSNSASNRTVQSFRESYTVAYPALQAAAASCRDMSNYGEFEPAAGDDAGPEFEGTSMPGFGSSSRPEFEGTSGYKKSKYPAGGYAGGSGTSMTSRGSGW
ncbi:hypothetical protein FGG08_006326 [Glutinoglossum americanum]|uniref:Uncharacterized protein n=1 Tax=Glutinoglossum americanum TaxID=1670608 RepID=A0A9P8I1R6_9PEZI|nr:hypothetical protein FGG08_006326 [Glutinoglossum americanum]